MSALAVDGRNLRQLIRSLLDEYDKVPSRSNQLLVFDDRVIHGVQPLQETMDPRAGRVVLHGHLNMEAGILNGALPADSILKVWPPFGQSKPFGWRYPGELSLIP
jgi:hypothetical protein